MRWFLSKACIALVAIVLAVPVFAQDAATPAQSPVDQPAKTEPQGHTVIIGCLGGPDANGSLTLRSMTYRTGVEVVGPDELKTDVGSKVKLTGLWKPGDEPAESPAGTKKARRFQATQVEVMDSKCEAPSEKTPISKEKQQRQQQKQKNSANPPPSGAADTPK